MVVVVLAFRWRLGMWNFSLLWYVPAVLLVFLNLYSVMVLVGVKTKSAITSILITLLVWGLSAGLHNAIGFISMSPERSTSEEGSEAGNPDQALVDTLETVHLFLPKNGPIMDEAERKVMFDGLEEFGGMAGLKETLKSSDQTNFEATFDELKESDSRFETIGSSCLFALVMLSLAARVFCRKEI